MTSLYRYLNAFVASGLFLLSVAGRVLAQPADSSSGTEELQSSQALRALNNPADNLYSQSLSCSGCHSGQGDFPPDVFDRACLKEYDTWQDTDQHADAFASLTSDRGVQIAQLLRKNVLDTDTGCIQCHSVASHLPEEIYDQSARETLISGGVGCEACHGPSSKWLSEHWQRPPLVSWESRSLKEKTDRGWIDVRSPVTRAELCASCHIGSAEEGRIITHEMFAAGHPPLTGFELESFADAMPRHWRYAQEKSNGANQPFQRTRNLLTAAVVGMRMAVELAAADAAAPQPAARWPGFARLDCFACHHELESPGDRPLGHLSRPGRPALAVGCLPLVRFAARLAGGSQAEEELNTLVRQLQAPFESNPFGDPAELAQQNEAVGEWCRSIEERLAPLDITPQQASVVLRQIAEQAADHHRDYDTARQLLGAWVIVYGELQAAGELPLQDTDRRRIDDLLGTIANEYPQMARREALTVACGTPPPQKGNYNRSLAQHYKNRVEYDPARFKDMMAQLEHLLPK